MFVWGFFFAVFPLATSLPLPPSALSLSGLQSRTALSWGGRGIWPSGSVPGPRAYGAGAAGASDHTAARPVLGAAGCGAGVLPAFPASSKGRCRFSTARPCPPLVPLAPHAPPLTPGQPGIPPLLPRLPKHPLLLLGQNSPAPHGCWALQGLCLIPMMTENRPRGQGPATWPPCPAGQARAGALLAWPALTRGQAGSCTAVPRL